MATPTTQTDIVLPGTAIANANGFSTTAVAPVPNSAIQPASPITMPTPQTVTPMDVNAYNQLLATQATNAQANADQTQSASDAEAKTNQSLSDMLLGKEAFTQQQAQEQNLPALQKQERDLQSTSMLQTANYIQGIRNLDAKNISQGERNTAQIEAQRQYAIDALLTNAQLSFTQGNIQTAQANVKAAVDLKYNAIEQKIANSDKVLARLDTLAGRADSKAIQAAKDRNDQLKADIAEKKAQDLATQKAITDATPFAPASVISQAQQAFKDGKSPVEIARILGPYNADYLKNQLLREQIEKTKAERLLIDTKSSNLTPQKGGVVTAPNGDAISLPTETLTAIGRLKLNEGQSNAVAFATRMIQANNNLKNQLGKINTTGGFYETTGYDPTSAGSGIGRLVGSDASRIYNTNSEDFIRAKLRKESGATITTDEMEKDAKIYTPSGAGLDEKDLMLADEKRNEAIKSMIAQAGPAAPYLLQYYEQAKQQGEVYMSSNPELNAWYNKTAQAANTATTAATNGGGTYGFQDNQK